MCSPNFGYWGCNFINFANEAKVETTKKEKKIMILFAKQIVLTFFQVNFFVFGRLFGKHFCNTILSFTIKTSTNCTYNQTGKLAILFDSVLLEIA